VSNSFQKPCFFTALCLYPVNLTTNKEYTRLLLSNFLIVTWIQSPYGKRLHFPTCAMPNVCQLIQYKVCLDELVNGRRGRSLSD